jgi:outer membrane lipoprotein-sorting protein
MKCKRFQEDITTFVYDKLPDHREKKLKEHIKICTDCKQMLGKFNMVKKSLGNVELEFDNLFKDEEFFVKKTISRIKEIQQMKLSYKLKAIFKDTFKKRKWIAYASTVLLVLIIFGYVLGFFNIFIKPQELSAQEILLKSLKFPEEIPEEIKSYHKIETHISYPPYGYLGYKEECKSESWFKTPDKYRDVSICSYPDNPYIEEKISEIIVLGNKDWQLQPDGTWILYKERDTSGWFNNIKEIIEEVREDILEFREESEANLIKEDEIAGREVYVIEYITRRDGRDYSCVSYIDKETFLILAIKNYDKKELVSETICNLIEYNIEIDDSVFKQPLDDVVIDAKSLGLTDFEKTNNIYEAEKKAGYKIPIPKYIPEGYNLGLIIIYPERDYISIFNRYGKLLKTEDTKNPYRYVSIRYTLNKEEGNITYFGYITIEFDKLVGLTDNKLYSVFMPLIERLKREEIQINKEIKVFYKPEYKSKYIKQRQDLQFAYNNIWIRINATSDISKEQLIKIAKSMLD